ncbi:MAG: hypothetical protein M3280_12465 [Actinomycetota bacterium]|nr:hypothetical protein [Actinomycetota bacterium]
MCVALPAGATVREKGRYSGVISFSYDDCGFPVEVSGEFSGHFRFREGKNRNKSAFFLMDNFSYSETHTNTDTGEWFLVRGNGVFNETKATRVEGTIFKFRSVEAGQPFVVEDSSGNVVLRDRGAIRRTILFDTEGDDEPGGTFLEFLDVDVSGPHPGFFADFCDIARDLIGS